MPLTTLPLSESELVVKTAADVLAEFSVPQKNPDVAVVRDAIAAAFAEGYKEYQIQTSRAALQSDPLFATGDYLKEYADEHEVVPAVGESEESLRTRIFASPSIVTPAAIEAAINEVIFPRTCFISELDLDGWFIHSTAPCIWESYVGANPDYPDRCYDLVPSGQPGGAVPTNNIPRSFMVRIPALSAQDEDFSFIGDSFFVSGDMTDPSTDRFIFSNQQTSKDLYDAVVARVESIKGQGITWSLVIDPSL